MKTKLLIMSDPTNCRKQTVIQKQSISNFLAETSQPNSNESSNPPSQTPMQQLKKNPDPFSPPRRTVNRSDRASESALRINEKVFHHQRTHADRSSRHSPKAGWFSIIAFLKS
jgi:hypothetical protein